MEITKSEESTSILSLPDNVLENILKLITKDRAKLTLVCKRFYDVVCRMEEDRVWYKLSSFDIIIKDERLEKLLAFTKPIDGCQLRRIRNFRLAYMQECTSENSDELWQFLQVQGKFVKNLKISTRMNFETLLKVLSLTTNVEQLIFDHTEIEPDEYGIIDATHLDNLKILKIFASENLSLEQLKIRKNSLKNFEFDVMNWKTSYDDSVSEFLMDQEELTEAQFSKSSVIEQKLPENFLKNCKKLEKLRVLQHFEGSREVFEQILSSQTDLKELTFTSPAWNELLDKISENLTKLTLRISNFSDKIFKFHNLTEIEIQSCDFDSFLTENSHSKIENSPKRLKVDYKLENLTSLKLSGCKLSKTEVFAPFFVNLKILKLEQSEVNFGDLLNSFSCVEEVHIHELCEFLDENVQKLDFSKISENKNLKILNLHFPLEIQNFEKFIQNYPNLLDLHLFIDNPNVDELKLILGQFQQIHSIFIIFRHTCVIDFDIFESIKEVPTLRFICIKNFGFSDCDEMEEETVAVLKEKFEEVEFYRSEEFLIDCFGITAAKSDWMFMSKRQLLEDCTQVYTFDDEVVTF